MSAFKSIRFSWLQILTMMITVIFMGSFNTNATPHTTNDGLSITFDGSGRATDLTVDSYPVLFSSGETGGFYIRDNTIDPGTGLPQGVTLADNLLQCPGFQDGVVECLTSDWTRTPNGASTITAEEPVPDSDDFAAKVMIDEDPPPPGDPSWAALSQVVNLSSISTTTNDLYYLMFEVATESGWRPYDHPDGWERKHGNHKIFARVEWFGTTPDPLPAPQPEPALTALATSTIECYETSVFDPGGGEAAGMTRFCLRTHRPVHPAEAKRARISLWVQGFLPGDGTTGANDNYVWFDNVYFFKAPDVAQVTGYGSGGNFGDPLAGLHALSMWVNITVETGPGGSQYILFDGAVRNEDTDTDNNPRAIDLGFALPILDAELGQNVTWWDDARNSTEISASDPTNWVPFRLTGPVDQRAATTLLLRSESGGELEISNTRAANNQISAYPFSVIEIENGSNGPYGVSFGEHLGNSQAPADPQVAHFGYYIEQPPAPLIPFIGRYYVEFNLGLLKPSVGNAEAPFSFILFRSDNPASPEESSFRDGTEKYQTTFFPFAFTRPTDLPPDDEWLFGGGIFNPEWNENENNWWQTGFTKDPNDFGLRYSRKGTTEDLTEDLTYGITRDVRVLIYDRPWTARFEHDDTADDDANTYTELRDQANDPQGSLLYPAQYDHQLKQLNVNGGISDLFSRGISDDLDMYIFPVLLADLDNPTYPIIDTLTTRYTDAYLNISVPHDNPEGLAGVLYDNVFNDMRSANHLDQDETRLEGYRTVGGAPTYSFNNFMPAIPQLVANARFLDTVDTCWAKSTAKITAVPSITARTMRPRRILPRNCSGAISPRPISAAPSTP